MAGSPLAIIRESHRGQAAFIPERVRGEEPPGGSQSVRSSVEAGNDRVSLRAGDEMAAEEEPWAVEGPAAGEDLATGRAEPERHRGGCESKFARLVWIFPAQQSEHVHGGGRLCATPLAKPVGEAARAHPAGAGERPNQRRLRNSPTVFTFREHSGQARVVDDLRQALGSCAQFLPRQSSGGSRTCRAISPPRKRTLAHTRVSPQFLLQDVAPA